MSDSGNAGSAGVEARGANRLMVPEFAVQSRGSGHTNHAK